MPACRKRNTSERNQTTNHQNNKEMNCIMLEGDKCDRSKAEVQQDEGFSSAGMGVRGSCAEEVVLIEALKEGTEFTKQQVGERGLRKRENVCMLKEIT